MNKIKIDDQHEQDTQRGRYAQKNFHFGIAPYSKESPLQPQTRKQMCTCTLLEVLAASEEKN